MSDITLTGETMLTQSQKAALREAAENIPVVPVDIAMLPPVTPSLKLRTTRQYSTPVPPQPNARQRRAMRNGAARYAVSYPR